VFPKPVKNPVARSCALFLTFAVRRLHAEHGRASKNSPTSSTRTTTSGYSARDKECMARAIFFESHRSSREGMVAVGTVVMNRVNSPNYPNTVCGVVGQKNQFAPGVMSRAMNSRALPDVEAAASAVLRGEAPPEGAQRKVLPPGGADLPLSQHALRAGGGRQRLLRAALSASSGGPAQGHHDRGQAGPILRARRCFYNAFHVETNRRPRNRAPDPAPGQGAGAGPALGQARLFAALHLIKKKDQLMAPLAAAMGEAVDKVRVCSTCGNVDTSDPCTICTDPRRDPATLIVVEDVSDLWALERASAMNVRYHVLGGTLSPLDGIGPDDLNIARPRLAGGRGRGERDHPGRQRHGRGADDGPLHHRPARRSRREGHGSPMACRSAANSTISTRAL
jgi:hypothetical protein